MQNLIIIRLGSSYLADYYGPFESTESAKEWMEKEDLDEEVCQIIFVRDPKDS